LPEQEPWPALGRKGSREARRRLTASIDRIAGTAISQSFDRSFEASQTLRYPNDSAHFLKMWFQALERQIAAREKGSGVRR
jgi:hypothetical protein